MIFSPPIDQLAEGIRERRADSQNAWQEPYILFLGEGCAQAAGAPSRAAIARQALQTFGFEGNAGDLQDAEVFDKFASHTASLAPAQLGRMLRSLYAPVPVPSFYQYLAILIRERYFPMILTTNFDTLLEQALAASGVRESDYYVTTFPDRIVRGSGEPLTHIVKLHGDLAQDIAQVTPDQIDEALRSSRRWIKRDLQGDLIMLEHILCDDPIDRWLGHSPARELWWISENPPPDPSKIASWSDRPVHEITGTIGRPSGFFAQLALRLLGPAEYSSPYPAQFNGVMEAPEKEPDPLDDPLVDSLRNEIMRNQAVLFSLDQECAVGERPPQLQAQIEYQKRNITRIEDRIRALPDVRPVLLECGRRIAGRLRAEGYSVVKNPGDAESMAAFAEAQVAALEVELAKEKPNQVLVAAAIGAILTLADRLRTDYGDRLIEADVVRRLAMLAPTAASKVVL
jgi:hypothetical protein